MSLSNPYSSKRRDKAIEHEHEYETAPVVSTAIETPIVSEKPESKDYLVSKVEEIPVGTANEILEWVGGDKGRAQKALDAEVDGKGRKTLTESLKAILS